MLQHKNKIRKVKRSKSAWWVKMMKDPKSIVLLVVVGFFLVGCGSPEQSSIAVEQTELGRLETNVVEPTRAPTGQASGEAPPSDHLIAIRQQDGVGEFYNRETGERFTPRGMNYVRLGPSGHNNFTPGYYQSAVVAEDLSKMHSDGYNVVRVFLSPEKIAAPLGLDEKYMDNVADFLRLARANQIFVMFTIDWVPGGKYGAILGHGCCATFEWMNANYLPTAGVEANQLFFQDFAKDLIQRKAATEYILAYELRNELFYDTNFPPFTLPDTVTTANGKSYDMADKAEEQRMMEENIVYWIDAVRASILEVDPSALVSVGFFAPHGPNGWRSGDSRVVVSGPAIWESSADFIDLHAYPGRLPQNWSLTLSQYVENFGVGDMRAKPIILGEFGGERGNFDSIFDFAQKIVDWQVESCDYGFDGWLYWTWDTNEQPDFFNALMENGAINGSLAPALRPDPCAP